MVRLLTPKIASALALALAVAGALSFAACAPRLRPGSGRAPVDDDQSRAENRRALEELLARAPEGRPAGREGEEAVAAERRLPVLPVMVLEPTETDAERGEGRISRSALRTFVEQGPHSLFRAVALEPVLNGERFQGYRIAALAPEPTALRTSGLRVGDIVTAVNGTDVSNPDGFMRLWEGLAEAEALTVEIVRGGDSRTLGWAIR
jgi:hypothetical protein